MPSKNPQKAARMSIGNLRKAEQAPVAANREFIRRFEAKIKTTIDRDWSAT